MKEVKTVDDCTIYQKRSGRYAVKSKEKKYLNAQDKVDILVKAGLVEEPKVKAVESEQPVEETSSESDSAEA